MNSQTLCEIRHDLQQAYIRYCEALDKKRFELLRTVFQEDCTRIYLKLDGSREIRDYDQQDQANRGLAVFLQRLRRDMGPETRIVTQHNVVNFQYDIRSPTDASVKCHFYAVHKRPEDAGVFSAWGEYDDDFALTDDGWRIVTRRYTTWLTEGENIIYAGKLPVQEERDPTG